LFADDAEFVQFPASEITDLDWGGDLSALDHPPNSGWVAVVNLGDCLNPSVLLCSGCYHIQHLAVGCDVLMLPEVNLAENVAEIARRAFFAGLD
jgi:hypothetical protein